MKIHRKFSHGFTLIELLIVVTIIGILTSVAIPSYIQYVQQGKRADARANLLQAAQYLQRFYAANDKFDADRSGRPITDTFPNSFKFTPNIDGMAAANADYQLDISGIEAQKFTLKMQPLNSMAGDKCGNLTLTNLGVKGISGTTATREECWK
jgi:type IV pilus assembly protein PilE